MPKGIAGSQLVYLSILVKNSLSSGLQRDLSDSTVMRNLGVAIAHTHLAIISIQSDEKNAKINEKAISDDLAEEWQLLSEPIQTVLRTHGIDDAYGETQASQQRKNITKEKLFRFIDSLDLPAETISQLKALTPSSYIGLAAKLAKEI